jgi:hypothetical protein
MSPIELTDGRGRGVGEEPNYTTAEKAWALFKSFNTLCSQHTLKKEKVSVTALSLPCLTAVLVLVLPAFVLQTFKCVLHSSDKREREKTKKCCQ